MKRILIAVLLTGCTAGPTYMPMDVVNPVMIQYHVHKDAESLRAAYKVKCGECLTDKNLYGFAVPPHPWGPRGQWYCEVHAILNEWAFVPHEIKHCLYGNWHSEEERI